MRSKLILPTMTALLSALSSEETPMDPLPTLSPDPQETPTPEPKEENPRFLKLDRNRIVPLGQPNQKQKVKDQDVEVQTHDEFGLPKTAKLYADDKCRQCYGRGVLKIRHALTREQAAEQFKDQIEREIDERWGDPDDRPNTKVVTKFIAKRVRELMQSHYVEETADCLCALKRYAKARIFVGNLQSASRSETPV